MYCGDETGSFIGEIGSHTCRFGYGGEDNPKLTMPSYVVRKPSDERSQKSLRMCRQSSNHPPKEEEVMESILRMASSFNANDQDGPITDPNAYLRQGEVVENWDTVQTAWEYSMKALRATDTLKHTKGGTPYEFRTKKQKLGHAQQSTEEESSTDDGGRCVHPILAVTPGFSEFTSGVDSEGSSTGPKYQAAIRRQQYIRYTELLMEGLDATSVFLAPAPMLAAFSLGRQTALVVDIGAGGCRVTPIVDGLILKQSQRRSGRGGDWLGDVTWRALLEEKERQQREDGNDSAVPVSIQPRYMQKETDPYVGKLTNSVFHRKAMNDLLYEIRTQPFVRLYDMENMEKVRIPFASHRRTSSTDVVMRSPPGTPRSTGQSKTIPETPESTLSQDGESSMYELPDGTAIELSTSSFGKDLCQLPELLFCEESALPYKSETSTDHSTFSNLPLHRLIRDSLLSVEDVDARKELAGCICLVGAGSLFPQLEKRLSQELSALLPSFVKPKVIAPNVSSVERSCAAWIGASVLTSLGSFQQLWLSKAEYEEYGAAMSIQRFP